MARAWLCALMLIPIAAAATAAPRLPARLRVLEQAARAESLALATEPGRAVLPRSAGEETSGCPGALEPDSYALSGPAFGTAVADFDGDGHPDVAAAVAGDSLRIYPNLGNGRLGPPHACPASYQNRIAAADLNGDGAPDLVAVGGAGVAQVLLNSGDGRFAPGDAYTASPPYWAQPLLADVDGDGHADLVMADYDSLLVVRYGDGAGGFTRTSYPDIAGTPRQVGIADLDGDGRADLVTRDPGWGRLLSVYLSRGAGVFERRDEPGDGAPFALGDFDGDGRPDLVLGRSDTSDRFGFRRGRGDGTFDAPADAGPAPAADYLEVADMDGDGRADLVGWSVAEEAAVVVLLGDGAGRFLRVDGYAFGVRTRGLSVADLDGDGLPEVVASDEGSDLLVARNRGGGRLAARELECAGNFASDVVAADLDGDGKVDLASVAYWENSVRVFRSRGDGSFEEPRVLGNPTCPIAIAAADITCDGLPDLVTLSADSPADYLQVHVNQGGGDFRAGFRVNLADLGYGPEDLAAADFDRDGATDLALAGHPAPALLRNSVIGPFDGLRLLAAAACDLVATGDFNGDGWPDLVTGAVAGRIWVLLNDGHGGFPDTAGYACPGASSLAVADLDGDGRDDLAVGDANRPGVTVFLSRPDGSLGSARTVAVSAPNGASVAALAPRPGAAADLVVAGYSWRSDRSPLVRLRNDGSGAFPLSCVSQVGAVANGLAVGDFDGNGALDLAVAHGNQNRNREFLTVAPEARSDPAATTSIALLAADASPDRVRLAWRVDGALAAATLYRRAAEGGWLRRATLAPDATGRLAFDDTDVTPGARYGYRIGLEWSPAAIVGGEVWVVVPRFGFALAGIRPNPARDDATRVAFVLAGAGAARLQVLDIAGRIVRARALDGLGPGPHEIALDAGPRLAPGVYLVRLTEGPRSAAARAVIAR